MFGTAKAHKGLVGEKRPPQIRRNPPLPGGDFLTGGVFFPHSLHFFEGGFSTEWGGGFGD